MIFVTLVVVVYALTANAAEMGRGFSQIFHGHPFQESSADEGRVALQVPAHISAKFPSPVHAVPRWLVTFRRFWRPHCIPVADSLPGGLML